MCDCHFICRKSTIGYFAPSAKTPGEEYVYTCHLPLPFPAVGILTLGWVNTSHRSVILEIKQTMDILKTQNIKIELNWIPGHAEIAGNEIAD